jgi:hypothetical protein
MFRPGHPAATRSRSHSNLMVLRMHPRAVAGPSDDGERALRHDVKSFALQYAEKDRGGIRLLFGEQSLRKNCYPCADALIRLSHFDADGTATDHHHRIGESITLEYLAVG